MVLCKKCGGVCNPSKALKEQMFVMLDDRGVPETQGFFAEPKITDCFKCVKCGHSFIPTPQETVQDDMAWELLKKLYDLQKNKKS